MRIYYKTKILINGKFPLENYKIDNYTEKRSFFSIKNVNLNDDNCFFSSSPNFLKNLFCCKNDDGYFYSYFENDDLMEMEVSNCISKEEIQKIVLETQIEEVAMLEKRLKLLSGMGINLPSFKTTIYNVQKNIWTHVGYNNLNFSHLSAMDYDDKMIETLKQRLHFYIAGSTLKKLEDNNQRFKRSLYFYSNSFSSSDIGIRFTLLFSALESIFNINGENITEEVSSFSSKILFLSEKDQKKSKYKLRTYYDMRSKFIHGNINYDIPEKAENDLRNYVREILLIYWMISITYDIYDATNIKEIILNTNAKTLDIQVQLFIKYLRTPPSKFKALYEAIKETFFKGNCQILNNENLNIK